MKGLLKNKWMTIGLLLAVFGWTPFVVAVSLRAAGSGADVDLNALGLLLFATFWPAVVCFTLAIAQTFGKRRRHQHGRDES